MKLGTETAATCGLFCGIFPAYPGACKACLSETVAAGCQSRANGVRACSACAGQSE